MRSRLIYARRLLWDWVRYGAIPGRVTSRALGGLSTLAGDPLRRLALLTRAARLEPTRKRLSALIPAMRQCLDRMPADVIDRAYPESPARIDMPKGIILKPPMSLWEKGVLYLTFEQQWLRLLRTGKADEIASRYDLVLGPSTSPPPQVELLLMAKHWPGKLFTLLGNLSDARLMRDLSPKLEPVSVLASGWVDPEDFTPHLGQPREYDIVMLAHFDPVKRHWLLFDALRKLPASYRVLLMGVPLGGRSERDLYDEARAFGVGDRFELLIRPSRAEVMSNLARSRVSLVFSRQEGACIAVTESLFAGTPVGMFRNARVGSKAYVNAHTGRLLDRRGLARQLREFVEEAGRYRPREWALRNISCHASRATLNEVLRRASLAAGHEWTRDLLPIRKDLVPSYLTARDEETMRRWYDDFAERYGLLLGPAARRAERALAYIAGPGGEPASRG